MNGEEKLYAIAWLVLATIVVTLILSIAVVNATTNVTNSNNITKMVLNNVMPVDAYCAIQPETQTGRCLVATIGAKRD
jgi:hypothetical protein